MLNYSIGEIESLVQKAYRGAGFSWGLAQEAGYAAGWMAMHELPVVNQFALLLPLIDGVEHTRLTPAMSAVEQQLAGAERLCPVLAGIALSDADFAGVESQELVLKNVLQPLILLPFLAHSVPALSVSFDSARYVLANKALEKSTVNQQHGNTEQCCDVHIQLASPHSWQAQSVTHRAMVPESPLAVLQAFAHRTYVPATESSRAGAGAGLLDND